MAVTSALVLYAVLWFATFLTVIPFNLKTQGDVGELVEGTHASAPSEHNLKKKAWITTGIAAVLWVICFTIVVTDVVTMSDIDIFNRMETRPIAD